MYNNVINIESIKGKVDNLRLSDTVNQGGYLDLFYEHLTGMLKFRMLGAKNDVDELRLNERTYLGLEEYILNHSSVVEQEFPNENIEWETIDKAKDILRNKIYSLLGNEAKSETLKPIINFTINSYENSLIYNNLHPKSQSNPWIPTDDILLKNGYLVLVSDQKDLVGSFSKKILESKKHDAESSDLFVVASSNSSKKFSGCNIDTRNKTQGLVYQYLRDCAKNGKKVLKAKDIVAFLKLQKRNYTEGDLKNFVLLPLKRAGLIGSTTSGYFSIESENDLRNSFEHHKEKMKGLIRTLQMHQLKARKMGFNFNLDFNFNADEDLPF